MRSKRPTRFGAAYGDAFLAGYATGIISSLDDLGAAWVTIDREVLPNPDLAETYGEYYALYRALYRHTAADQHALARIGSRDAEFADG